MNKLINKTRIIFKKSFSVQSKLNFLTITKKLDSFFSKIINFKAKNEIYIYCAFDGSIPIIKYLNQKKICIKGIIDTNPNLQNKLFFNIKIFNLDDAYKNYLKNKNIIILVTHPENKTYLKIKSQIIKEGFPANNIKNIGYKKIFKL